ncbi:hypothetical protein ACJZ2D_015721 [Fusarium nematophilum]
MRPSADATSPDRMPDKTSKPWEGSSDIYCPPTPREQNKTTNHFAVPDDTDEYVAGDGEGDTTPRATPRPETGLHASDHGSLQAGFARGPSGSMAEAAWAEALKRHPGGPRAFDASFSRQARLRWGADSDWSPSQDSQGLMFGDAQHMRRPASVSGEHDMGWPPTLSMARFPQFGLAGHGFDEDASRSAIDESYGIFSPRGPRPPSSISWSFHLDPRRGRDDIDAEVQVPESRLDMMLSDF